MIRYRFHRPANENSEFWWNYPVRDWTTTAEFTRWKLRFLPHPLREFRRCRIWRTQARIDGVKLGALCTH